MLGLVPLGSRLDACPERCRCSSSSSQQMRSVPSPVRCYTRLSTGGRGAVTPGRRAKAGAVSPFRCYRVDGPVDRRLHFPRRHIHRVAPSRPEREAWLDAPALGRQASDQLLGLNARDRGDEAVHPAPPSRGPRRALLPAAAPNRMGSRKLETPRSLLRTVDLEVTRDSPYAMRAAM